MGAVTPLLVGIAAVGALAGGGECQSCPVFRVAVECTAPAAAGAAPIGVQLVVEPRAPEVLARAYVKTPVLSDEIYADPADPASAAYRLAADGSFAFAGRSMYSASASGKVWRFTIAQDAAGSPARLSLSIPDEPGPPWTADVRCERVPPRP